MKSVEVNNIRKVRLWWENEGDIVEIRRAKAEAAALSHMTPTILPGELLFGNKTRNLRRCG